MKLPEAFSIQRLFLLVIVLKVLFSFAAWAIGGAWATWVLGFFVPLLLMAVYVAIGCYRRDPAELSDEKFADSCYYLGFIFTITSIILSLFDLPVIGERMDEIAVRFGAAMVSTVAGLVVRVYLVNFRKDLFDIKKTIEDDLLDAEHTFRTHLQLSVDRLRAFESLVDGASRDAVARVELAIEAAAASYSERFQLLFEKIAADNRRVAEESIAHAKLVADKLDEILSEHATALVRSMNELQKCVDEFGRGLESRLRRMTFPDDFLVASLGAPVARLRGVMDEISGQVSALSGALRGGATRVGAALEALAQQADRITHSMEQTDAAASANSGLADLAREELRVLAELRKSIAEADTSIGRSMHFLKSQYELIARLTADVDRMATNGEVIEQQLRGHAEIAQLLASEARVLHAVNRSAQDELAAIRQTRAVLDRDLGSRSRSSDERSQQEAAIAAMLERVAGQVAESARLLDQHARRLPQGTETPGLRLAAAQAQPPDSVPPLSTDSGQAVS